ncbi:MAG TPA: DUF4142 domain-containing protein [Steroidobacteraceae bacterium]|jgi:putative membrane protein
MNIRLFCAAVVVLQCISLSALADQEEPLRPTPGSVAEPTTDRVGAEIYEKQRDKELKQVDASLDTQSFVQKAALDGMTEVQLAQVALKKSHDDATLNFARRMVKDHTAAGEKLAAVATQQGATVPTNLDGEHQQLVLQAQSLNGSAFDAEYGKQMKAAHDKAVALFESAARNTQVAEPVREFAADTLPTLKEHLHMAADLTAGSMATDK